MIRLQRQWLGAVPWETVISVNEALCRDRELEPGHNGKTYETARQLWERSNPKSMSLPEVLEICRRCHELMPFTFNNASTFAAISKTLVEDWLRTMQPLEAHIVRTTIAHYVAGMVGKKELQQVLAHFEGRWSKEAAPVQPQPERPTPQPKAPMSQQAQA